MNKLEKMESNNSLSKNLKEITFFSLILSIIINFISYNTNEYYILEQFIGLEYGAYNFVINTIPTFLIILISLAGIFILFNRNKQDNIELNKKTKESQKKDILNDSTLEKKKKNEDTIIKNKIKKESKVDLNKKKKVKSQELSIENKKEEKDLPKKNNLKKKEILKKKTFIVKKEYTSLEEIEKEFEKYNLLFVKRIYGKRTHSRKILELEKEVEKLKSKGVIDKNYTLF